MSRISLRHHLISTAIVSAVLLCASADVLAQTAQERAQERRDRQAQKSESKDKGDKQAAVMFPDATRKAPDVKASSKLAPKLQKMVDAYNDDKAAEGRAIADEIIANPSANAYEHAFAAQIGAQLAYGADDTTAAKAYLQKALEFDGLDNNGHYQSMLMLAQLQLQDDQYKEALATIDRFLSETKSTKPEYLVLKGNALYRLERYPEAAAVLEQAIAATPDPKPDWQQLLMGAYAEMGQPEKATKLAEAVAAKTPNDKKAQLNLAAVYMQADQNDKAIAVLEKLRAAGQLTEDRDYRNLYALYLNSDGKEKQAIAVIDEGLAKGILKPDYQAYVALAQANYYSDQPGPAIEAYKKAAPIAPDGETYLNLAKLLWGENRIGEAKQAAKQALDKGLKKPEEARKILALKGG